jgi:hypothetical protein
LAVYLGRRTSREGWRSFETDPLLRRTKHRLHGRCLPCLTGLHEQLRTRPERIELREAWNCWKVTIVVGDEQECFTLLEAFAERYPDAAILGKFGGGFGRSTSAVVFHVEEEQWRDELLQMLGALLSERFPNRQAFASRACSDPYEALLGPWKDWERSSKILHLRRVGEVQEKLRASLYRGAW